MPPLLFWWGVKVSMSSSGITGLGALMCACFPLPLWADLDLDMTDVVLRIAPMSL